MWTLRIKVHGFEVVLGHVDVSGDGAEVEAEHLPAVLELLVGALAVDLRTNWRWVLGSRDRITRSDWSVTSHLAAELPGQHVRAEQDDVEVVRVPAAAIHQPAGRPRHALAHLTPHKLQIFSRKYFLLTVLSTMASVQCGKAGQCSRMGQCTKPRCWKGEIWNFIKWEFQ